MSYVGPFATVAEIVERTTRLIDIKLPKDPRVPQYRLWGAHTLDDAYGAPTGSAVTGAGAVQILEVMRGEYIRTPGLVKRGAGLVEESFRNMTRVKFDIEEFSDPGLPQDDEFLFLRVQEYNLAQGDFGTVQGAIDTGNPILGPIKVIPSAAYFGNPTAAITIAGTAPTNTGCVFGSIPVFHDDWQAPNPMQISLPLRTTAFQIQVFSATAILVSFGMGMPMTRITNTEAMYFQATAAAIKDIVLASSDNSGGGAVPVPFAINAVLAFGPE